MEFVLASSSKSRYNLLKQAKLNFTQYITDFDENIVTSTDPQHLCIGKAEVKGQHTFNELKMEKIVIGCDTVGFFNGKILEKPKSKEECIETLQMLSGNTVTIYSGMSIFIPKQVRINSKINNISGKYVAGYNVKSTEQYTQINIINYGLITFREITPQEIEVYSNTDEPYTKAGGFNILESSNKWVDYIEGDLNAIVGLSVSQLSKILPCLK